MNNKLYGNRIMASRGLILLACFTIYLFWACNLPSNLAPDEPMRLMVPNFIVQNGYLPLGNDPSIINSTWGTSYGFSAYGSSLFAVPFMCVANALFGTTESLVIAARIANICLSIGTLACCFAIADALRLSNGSAILFVILVALLPQYAFLSSYFNSDILEFLSTALCILFLIKGHQSHWALKYCILLGVSLGIVALANYYAYGAILACIVFYFGSVHYLRGESTQQNESALRSYLVKPMLILLCALVIGGWFFVRNFILYDGDLFGMGVSSDTSEMLAESGFKPSERPTPKSLGYNPIEMLLGSFAGSPWILYTVKSSIGIIGPMQFEIGRIAYCFYGVALYGGFLAGFINFVRTKTRTTGIIILSAFLILATPIFLSVYYSWSSDYQAQGRYIMAGISLFMLVVSYGWSGLISTISQTISSRLNSSSGSVRDDRVGQKYETVLFAGLIALYVAVFVYVFLSVAIPNCFGTVVPEYLPAVLNQ